MILDDIEIAARIESPLNLLNRLKSSLTKRVPGHNHIPSIPPTTDQLIEDIEDKIKYGTIKSKASAIMVDALDQLHNRLPEVQRPEKLSQIASDMNKVIGVKVESKSVSNAQVIIYAPQHNSETHYEVLHVAE